MFALRGARGAFCRRIFLRFSIVSCPKIQCLVVVLLSHVLIMPPKAKPKPRPAAPQRAVAAPAVRAGPKAKAKAAASPPSAKPPSPPSPAAALAELKTLADSYVADTTTPLSDIQRLLDRVEAVLGPDTTDTTTAAPFSSETEEEEIPAPRPSFQKLRDRLALVENFLQQLSSSSNPRALREVIRQVRRDGSYGIAEDKIAAAEKRLEDLEEAARQQKRKLSCLRAELAAKQEDYEERWGKLHSLGKNFDRFLDAAGGGDVGSLKKMLDEFPTFLDLDDTDGSTALSEAAGAGENEAVTFLLHAGANPNGVDEKVGCVVSIISSEDEEC